MSSKLQEQRAAEQRNRHHNAHHLPELVTGALSPTARLSSSGTYRGVEYEVYFDQTDVAPTRPSKHGGVHHAHRWERGRNYAAVVYSPYESETHGHGSEAEQIAYLASPMAAAQAARNYIDKLLSHEGREPAMQERRTPPARVHPGCIDRRKLGEMMSPWGGDTGSGLPVYAVGSYYFGGHAYPDRAMVERAITEVERMIPMAKQGMHGWTNKDAADLRKIANGLKCYLTLDYPSHGGADAHPRAPQRRRP